MALGFLYNHLIKPSEDRVIPEGAYGLRRIIWFELVCVPGRVSETPQPLESLFWDRVHRQGFFAQPLS